MFGDSISYDELNGFLLESELELPEYIYILILNSCNEKTYSKRLFNQFLCESTSVALVINTLKTSLINRIFTTKMYNNILKRQFYYINHPDRISTPPKENCCEYLQRVLFTTIVYPPLHYDYILSKPSVQSINELLLVLKHLKEGNGKVNSSLRRVMHDKHSLEIIMSPKTPLKSRSSFLTSIRCTKVTPVNINV